MRFTKPRHRRSYILVILLVLITTNTEIDRDHGHHALLIAFPQVKLVLRSRIKRTNFYVLRLEEAFECIRRLPPPGNGRRRLRSNASGRQRRLDDFTQFQPHAVGPALDVLKLIHWNARSLSKEKAHELSLLATQCDTNVIAVSEIGKYDANIPSYSIRSRDTRGQGVAIYCKNDIRCSRAIDIENNLSKHGPKCIANVLCFPQASQGRDTLLFHCYVSPSATSSQRKEFFKDIVVATKSNPFILCGDLNDRWTGFSSYNVNRTSPVQDVYDTLTICNDGSVTRPQSESAIDVTLCSGTINNTHWSTLYDLGSDHLPIRAEFSFSYKISHQCNPKRYVIKDWKAYIAQIEAAIAENVVTDISQLLEYITLHTPQRRSTKSEPKPFWNEHLTSLKRKRNKYRRKKLFKQYNIACRKLRKEFKRYQRRHKLQQLQACARPGSNPYTALYSVLPGLRRTTPTDRVKPSLIDARRRSSEIGQDFVDINNDESIACPRAEAFVQRWIDENPLQFSGEVQCSEREVVSAIMRVQSRSAPGPDRLTGQLFKQLIQSQSVVSFLTKEITKILNSGQLPQISRERYIVSISKGNGSFRPISLLTVFSKIVDRIVSDRLKESATIRSNQFGCRRGHATHHALERVLHFSGITQVQRKQFVLLTLDFSKAYDRVNPFVLLAKLIEVNTPTYIIYYVYNWMIDRSFRVLYHGAISQSFTPRNGLPQGSPLSVILWLCFINDIDVDDSSSNIFMDDTAIWASADTTDEALKILTKSLHRVESWCITNKVKLNHDKSGWIANTSDLARKTSLRLADGGLIAERLELKYLGTTFKSSISSTVLLFDHSILIGKLRRYNGLLKRVRGYLSEHQLTVFAKSLILSRMDYFLPLMGMETDEDIEPLEVVWRETLRIITGALKSTPIALLYAESGLPPLKILIPHLAGKLWYRTNTCPDNIINQEMLEWDGVGDGWSPLGVQWEIERFMTRHMRGDLTLQLPGRDLLDKVYRCQFRIVGTIAEALTLHERGDLLKTPSPVLLWTDGSYRTGLGGLGCLLTDANANPLSEYAKGIRNVACSYQTEVQALLGGLRHTQSLLHSGELDAILSHTNFRENRSLTVFTDCRSVLSKLCKLPIYPKRVNQYWLDLLGVIGELIDDGFSMHFIWIPGHQSIPCNEHVDILAKDALKYDNAPLKLSTSRTEIYKLLRGRSTDKFKEWLKSHVKASSWDQCPTRTRFILPKPPGRRSRKAGVSRRLEVQLFRLRSGHSQARACLNRFYDVEPDCRLCHDAPETPTHLFLECRRLSSRLRSFRRAVSRPTACPSERVFLFNYLLNDDDSQDQLLDAIHLLNKAQIYL